MSIVDQFENALQIARQAGYVVRFEYFGGTGGGICEFAGRKVLFVDLALSTVEQLEKARDSFAQAGLDWPIESRRAA